MGSTVISSIIFQFSPPVINFAIINFTMWYNHLIHCCSSYSYKFLLNIFIRNKMKKVLFLISPYYLSCVLPFFIKFQVSDLYNFLLSEELVVLLATNLKECVGYRILGFWPLSFFCTLHISLHCLLVCMFSDRKPVIIFFLSF